ncbi:hypothetical protein V6S02_11235 [Microbacterium sp. CCNWLW134]
MDPSTREQGQVNSELVIYPPQLEIPRANPKSGSRPQVDQS